MKRFSVSTALLLVMLALAPAAFGQQSTSFRLEEQVFNAGGRPGQGGIGTSTSFRISLEAIGESLVASGPSSSSFQLDGGFVAAYPPPGEVLGLQFLNTTTLEWDPEGSGGLYNLYRGKLHVVSLGYGACHEQEIAATTTNDFDVPPSGTGLFYLVTVENRLAEEGSNGTNSNGVERNNGVPCP